MQWSPEVNSTIGYTFSKIGFNASLFYKFTGKRPYYAVNTNQEVVLTEQEAYHLADLTFSKQAFKFFSFSAGIRNLFDVDRIYSAVTSNSVHSSGGTRNIASGRSLFVGMNFNWNKK